MILHLLEINGLQKVRCYSYIKDFYESFKYLMYNDQPIFKHVINGS